MDIKCEYCGVESAYPCHSTRDMEDFAEDGNEECLNQLALKDGGEKGLRYVILNRYIKVSARANLPPNELQKAAGRIVGFLTMMEADAKLIDSPMTDGDVVASFMGSGASDMLTVGVLRKLKEALIASQ